MPLRPSFVTLAGLMFLSTQAHAWPKWFSSRRATPPPTCEASIVVHTVEVYRAHTPRFPDWRPVFMQCANAAGTLVRDPEVARTEERKTLDGGETLTILYEKGPRWSFHNRYLNHVEERRSPALMETMLRRWTVEGPSEVNHCEEMQFVFRVWLKTSDRTDLIEDNVICHDVSCYGTLRKK